jgi:glycosyltransferase involved in cell wall biosynthesis
MTDRISPKPHLCAPTSGVKTVHVVTGIEASRGGAPRVAVELMRAMKRDADSVQLVTTHAKGATEGLLDASGPVASVPRTQPRFWYAGSGFGDAMNSCAIDADILHVHQVWSYPQFAGARFGLQRGIPHVLTPHGELEPARLRHKGPHNHFKKWAYLKTIGHSVIHSAKCVHLLSDAEESGVRAVGYRGPVAVVPNGVNIHDFSSLPPKAEAEARWPVMAGRRLVLFFSRLSPEKGLCRLIPAWNEVVRQPSFSDALLVLAGPDDRGHGKVVDGLVERFGLRDHVLATGMIDGEDRLRLISRADVYTLPSFSEGFSISLLENLAAGKPVLITPGCNFPEAAAAGAGLCVSPEIGPLADALRGLLDLSDEQRREMGRRGRELVARDYTWECVSDKMLTLYRCVLEGREIPLHPQRDGPTRNVA